MISNSLISNNCLSRSENLVPVFKWKSNNRQQNIVEKRRNCSQWQFHLFSTTFLIYLALQDSNYIYSFVTCGSSINFSSDSANLICQNTDISKCFRDTLGPRDNESRLILLSR